MKRQAREVAAIKSDTLNVAVDKATIYLSRYIDQFQPEKGLEDNRRISDGGTVELYSQIVRADPDAADKWIVNMIRAADDGDAALDRGLRAIAASLIEKGEPLPEALRGWYVKSIRGNLRQRGKPGPDPQSRTSRNAAITSTVVWIAEQYSIHRTRTRHTKPGTGRNESACSIVAKALEGIGHQMSEVNIEKIVKKTLE